jgi:hypothetical protein
MLPPKGAGEKESPLKVLWASLITFNAPKILEFLLRTYLSPRMPDI